MRNPNGLRPSGTASADIEELSDSDLLAGCREYPRGSREQAAACDVLVRRYTPLVRASVRQYGESKESLEELMQVGFVGLLKAIGNYDPAFGNGLRAYAAPCITGEVKRYFRDKRWQVRATRPVQELMLELRGAHEDLTHELGRLPFESELAGRLGVTPDELSEARRAAQGFSALSLNAPAGEADGAEQRVLILRYVGNLTQEEVAARLGVSQMHVSRLQARALARLRARLLPPPASASP
jgi:RNA polymerase sigma-B factor